MVKCRMLRLSTPFGSYAKIPISYTLSELAEMDFADYGGYAAFLHIRGAFSRFPAAVFIGSKKRAVEVRKCPSVRRFRIS